MKFDTIIFDYDGTLADTAPLIVHVTKETLRHFGVNNVSEELVRSNIGLPLVDCLRLDGKLSSEQAEEAVVVYRRIFAEALDNTVYFPGVAATLAFLHSKGIRMGIATSRSTGSLHAMLDSHNLRQYFTAIVTVDDGLAAKPAPDMALEVLKRLGSDATSALMVGDTSFDLKMGRCAGCFTCGVTYGNHPRARLLEAQADYLIDSFNELELIV